MIYFSMIVGVLAGASAYVGCLHWQKKYLEITPACTMLLLSWCITGGVAGGGGWWLMATLLSK